MFLDCHFIGELSACSVGTNFTPHVITVNAGEVCLVIEEKTYFIDSIKIQFHFLIHSSLKQVGSTIFFYYEVFAFARNYNVNGNCTCILFITYIFFNK